MTTVPPWARPLLRAPGRLYDWHLGWLLGHRFLRLTHLGRRSGRRYRTVLEVLHHDRDSGELVVMAGVGRRADWYRNVLAAPPLEVAVASRRFEPRARVLDAEEAAGVLAAYEHDHRWVAPVVRRVLSRLVGWPYDGSAAARRRLVAERPLVGLAPCVSTQG